MSNSVTEVSKTGRKHGAKQPHQNPSPSGMGGLYGLQFPAQSTHRKNKKYVIPLSHIFPVSHIIVISKDFDLTDLGEYNPQNIRSIIGIPHPGLIIDYPEKADYPQGERKYFVSTSDDIGIMEMMSYSNKNSHCLIFGSVEGEPLRQETGWLYRIKPYFSRENREETITNMVEIFNVRAQLKKKEPEPIPRPNPITERLKQVQL
ncbi:MAG: hypothetical protein PHW62_00355 [Candidatus Ratteibacteria bacterium]|nr:hypothetical protein [Candidatus Ratteibacteria bacterium]